MPNTNTNGECKKCTEPTVDNSLFCKKHLEEHFMEEPLGNPHWNEPVEEKVKHNHKLAFPIFLLGLVFVYMLHTWTM